MLRKFILVSMLLLLTFTVPLAAQLTDVSGHAGFSAESAKFEFSGLAENSDASRALARWGITFESGADGTARVVGVVALGFTDNRIRNVPPSGTSANRPLILDFQQPVSKVGFLAGNGGAGTEVSITAFDPAGESVGAVQHTGLAEPTVIEVSTSHAAGIAKLLISYGAAAEAEEIDDLQVQFVDRPQFETYLAQVANGPIPSVGILRTTLVVANLSNSTAQGEIEFFDDDGDPLQFQIGDTVASSFDLSIAAVSSVTLVTGGSNLAVGYARIRSNVPVEGTGIFRVLTDTGAVVAEAGVGSAAGTYTSLGAVQKVVAGGFDSGIAVVNVSSQASTARAELYDESGHLVATNPDVASIGPGEHRAAFLSQIFPQVAGSSFSGTIRLSSDVPMAVVILRAANGLVRSSLPVGSLER
ncbi:MAG: hypothetical protein WAO20_16615 [Acidobacteriota bacterium]